MFRSYFFLTVLCFLHIRLPLAGHSLENSALDTKRGKDNNFKLSEEEVVRELRVLDSTGLLRAWSADVSKTLRLRVELLDDAEKPVLYLENYSGDKLLSEKTQSLKIFTFDGLSAGVWQIRPKNVKVVKVTIY
jgi:hypothetical protein